MYSFGSSLICESILSRCPLNQGNARQVLKLFADETIAGETPFADVRTQAFAILPETKLDQVADHFLQTTQLDEHLFQWEHTDQIAHRFKRRLRPLLRAIDFSATAAHKPLLTAVHFLKEALQKSKPLMQYKPDKFPQRFITEQYRRYLYTADDAGEKQLLSDRYEFLIYRLLRNNLESGDVFCRPSVCFRSFEDDLLSDEQWQEKETLIAQVGLPILTQTAEAHLAELKGSLEIRLKQVNQRIASGENEHIKIIRGGRWHLPYSRVDEDVNDPFFEPLAQVDIQAVFQFVDRHCQLMNEFAHVLHRYAGRQADSRTLTACILAWGTNMGLGRMSQTSDIGY